MANSQVQKLETNVYLEEAAEVVFDVFCNKTYYIAKAFPTKVKSIDINEGEWGTKGSIISKKYVHDGKNCVAKEVIGDIDRENYKLSFKVIEGDLLQNYKSFKFVIQFTPKENGSVAKLVLEYEKQNYDTPDPLTMIQFGNEVIKKVGAFLKKE
ncbi:hypothetical protein V8G54_025434 [Vigna mungo]|uniref:Bet v I/Major latex protein domain-containing protein n=1 Tax=Vigna mungo TaxID=3915 RepID=A0AAQ3MYQ8_VIGMU